MKRLVLFLFLLSSPAWGQTSQTGRVETGVSTAKPITCSPSDQFNATDNFHVYVCGPANTWTDVTGGGGGGTSPGPPVNSLQLNIGGVLTGAGGISTPDSGNSVDVHGPIPWFDVASYGTYTSSNNPTSTTANCTATMNTITVAAAIDFAVGHGIRLAKCGPNAVLATPPTPTVTPFNITGGGTTYSYQVSAEDLGGGLTAASSAGQTTTGQATLGLTSLSLSSVARVSGVTTYTLSSPLSTLVAGQQVNVTGFTGTSFDGVFTISSVPLTTTFTINQVGLADNSETNSATAQVLSCNRVTLASNSVSATIDTGGQGSNILRYWYWRNKSGGAFSLVGVAVGADPYFEDCGADVDTARTPDYVPSTPLVSSQAGYLATTITNIVGTTFTLAASASQTANGVNALHDNGPNIIKAAKALGANGVGGRLFLPSAINPNQYYVINSLVDLRTANISYGSGISGLYIQGWLQVNQPILPMSNGHIEGMPSINGFSFSYGPMAFVVGNSIPIFFIKPTTSSPVEFRNLKIDAVGNQSIGVFADNLAGVTGAGSSGIIFDQVGVGFGNQAYGSPITLKGGVDYLFKNGPTCSAHTGTTWNGSPGCVRFTDSSTAFNPTNSQVPGRVQFDNLYCSVLCVQIDTDPSRGSGGAGPSGTMGAFNFKGGIYENVEGPFVRLRADGPWGDFTFNDIQIADALVGGATPNVDASGTTSFSPPITFQNVSTLSQNAPALVVDSTNVSCRMLILNAYNGVNPGNCTTNIAFIPTSGVFGGATASPVGANGAYEYLNNGMAIASGTNGKLGYVLVAPTATTVSASTGGAWPTGTFYFAWTAVDQNGYETSLSNIFTLVVTGGNQTLASTCTPPALTAAVTGFYFYWSNGGGFSKQTSTPQATCSISGLTAQGGNGVFGAAPPNATLASIDSNGVTGYQGRFGSTKVGANPPTAVVGSATGIIGFGCGTVASVPTAGQAAIRCDLTTQRFLCTTNGLAEVPCFGAAGTPVDFFTPQTAAIPATNINNSLPTTARYRVCFSAAITTVGSVSATLGGTNGFQVIYTAPEDNVQKTTAPVPGFSSNVNSTSTAVGGCQEVYAKAGTVLQVKFDYTSNAGGTMAYVFHAAEEDGNP